MIAALFVLLVGGLIIGRFGEAIEEDWILMLGAGMAVCGLILGFAWVAFFLWKTFP